MSSTTTTLPTTAAGSGGMAGLLRGEWTKLWTVRATWWSLVAALFLQGLQAAGMGASFANGAIEGQGERLPLDLVATGGLQLAQLAVIGLAMLAVTTEFSTGSIAPSLQAVPRRWRLVVAKVAVVGVVGAIVGVVLVVAGAAAGWVGAGVFADGGIGAVFADPWSGVDASGLGRAMLLGGTYLGLLSAFTVGVATTLRSAVATLLTIIAVLLVLPGILAGSSLAWVAAIADHLPGGAAAALLGEGPYGAGRGVGVLAAWAVAAVVAGVANLHRRDA